MPVIIRLTDEDGCNVYVNASRIRCWFAHGDKTRIEFDNDYRSDLSVDETPEQIDTKIDNAISNIWTLNRRYDE